MTDVNRGTVEYVLPPVMWLGSTENTSDRKQSRGGDKIGIKHEKDQSAATSLTMEKATWESMQEASRSRVASGVRQHKKQGPQSYNHSKCILPGTVVSLKEKAKERKTQPADTWISVPGHTQQRTQPVPARLLTYRSVTNVCCFKPHPSHTTALDLPKAVPQ